MFPFHKKQGGALNVRKSRLTIGENLVTPCRFFQQARVLPVIAPSIKSIAGQSLLHFLVTLTDGSLGIDSNLYIDPYVASVAQAQSALEKLIQESNLPESFLVVGLIRAIENVLEDYAQEADRNHLTGPLPPRG